MFKAIYNLLQKRIGVGVILKEFSLIAVSSIFTMFLVGYFTINLDDGLGWGYGYYNYYQSYYGREASDLQKT